MKNSITKFEMWRRWRETNKQRHVSVHAVWALTVGTTFGPYSKEKDDDEFKWMPQVKRATQIEKANLLGEKRNEKFYFTVIKNIQYKEELCVWFELEPEIKFPVLTLNDYNELGSKFRRLELNTIYDDVGFDINHNEKMTALSDFSQLAEFAPKHDIDIDIDFDSNSICFEVIKVEKEDDISDKINVSEASCSTYFSGLDMNTLTKPASESDLSESKITSTANSKSKKKRGRPPKNRHSRTTHNDTFGTVLHKSSPSTSSLKVRPQKTSNRQCTLIKEKQPSLLSEHLVETSTSTLFTNDKSQRIESNNLQLLDDSICIEHSDADRDLSSDKLTKNKRDRPCKNKKTMEISNSSNRSFRMVLRKKFTNLWTVCAKENTVGTADNVTRLEVAETTRRNAIDSIDDILEETRGVNQSSSIVEKTPFEDVINSESNDDLSEQICEKEHLQEIYNNDILETEEVESVLRSMIDAVCREEIKSKINQETKTIGKSDNIEQTEKTNVTLSFSECNFHFEENDKETSTKINKENPNPNDNQDDKTKCVLKTDDRENLQKEKQHTKINKENPNPNDNQDDKTKCVLKTDDRENLQNEKQHTKINKENPNPNDNQDDKTKCVLKTDDRENLQKEKQHTKIRNGQSHKSRIVKPVQSKKKLLFETNKNGKYSYKCGICEEKFPLKAYLLCHIAVIHDNPTKDKIVTPKKRKTEEDTEYIVSSAKKNNRKKTKEQTFECPSCGKKYKFEESLKFHRCE